MTETEKPVLTVLTTNGDTKGWLLMSKSDPSKSVFYFHNPDGPAVEAQNGHKEWIVDGQSHRLDGPAIESPAVIENGEVYEKFHKWFIYGKELPQDEVEIWLKDNNIDLKTKEGQMAFKLMWV